MSKDSPKSLGDPAEREARRSLLQSAHVAPLTRFVENLRLQKGEESVPYFDPLDGGVTAEYLFLLEAPGGRAVGTGFVSRNNPDETAKNFFLLNQEAGLARERSVVWNVVPWYVGSGIRIRPATTGDIASATPYLLELFALLPSIRAIVLLGEKAQRARKILDEIGTNCKIFARPHLSPLALNGRPHRSRQILDCLKDVVALLDAGSDASSGPRVQP